MVVMMKHYSYGMFSTSHLAYIMKLLVLGRKYYGDNDFRDIPFPYAMFLFLVAGWFNGIT